MTCSPACSTPSRTTCTKQMRKPRLRDRLEYALFASAIAAAGRMPQARAEAMGAAIGRLGYTRLGIRRKEVEEHLRRAFPEREDAWVRDTAEASYEHFGREMITTLRLSHMKRDEVVRWVDHSIGRERFYEAFHEGRGLVLVGGHFGNWELGVGSVAARNYPVAGI